MLSVSVILCTYQGERFLKEQLASLRAQSRVPSEVIARDDCSADSTFRLLQEEAGKPGKFPILVKQNPTRLGFAQNFAAAVNDASGEILFFCDQDDIWEPEKIATIAAKFENDPALLMACSEATFIDANGAPLPGKVLAGNGMDEGEMVLWNLGRAFPLLLRRNPVPGMTMALRRSFLAAYLPVPEGWEHDYWALLLAAGKSQKIAVERKPLVQYRQHSTQAIGGEAKVADRWRRAESQSLRSRQLESEKFSALSERLSKLGAPGENIAMAEGKRNHLVRRAHFAPSRIARAVEIAFELTKGDYHRYGAGLSSAMKDWLASP